MGQTLVQQAEVTLTPTLDQYVDITPAVNTTDIQKPGVVVAGVNQTVTVRPAE